MKITVEDKDEVYEFEIPEWAREKRLMLLAGVELVARKVPWDDFWEVKDNRCTMCGQCCMMFKPNSTQTIFGVDDEGKCKALSKEGDRWECKAGTHKPYSCLEDSIDLPECSITRRKVKTK